MSAEQTKENVAESISEKQDKNIMPQTGFINKWFNFFGIYSVVILFLIIGYFVSPRFFTYSNFMNILRGVSILGMVSFGVAFVTYSGNFADLSVPVIMAFSGVIAVEALALGIIPAIILGIMAGMLIGLINGVVIGYLDANPILWTLSVAFAMEGFMRFTWSNDQVYPDISEGAGRAFVSIFRFRVLPGTLNLPFFVVAALVVFLISLFIMNKTKFGLHAKFVGSSKEAAECSGIDVKKTVLLAFLFASFTSAIAGIFLTSFNRFGVFYLGEGYDFQSVTAIVLGGVTLAGGRGKLFGVLGGVILIGLLRNIMTYLGIGTFAQNIVTGSIFIIVVGLTTYSLRKAGKDYE